MNNFAQKLSSTYWLNKLKEAFKCDYFFIGERKEIRMLMSNEDYLYFYKLTNSNEIAEYTVLLSIFNSLLCRYFDSVDFMYSTKMEEDIPLFLKIESIRKKTFKQYLQDIKSEVQEVYQHSNYDKKLLEKHDFKNYTNYGFLYGRKEYLKLPFVFSVTKVSEGIELGISYDTTFVNDNVSNHFLKTFKSWILNLEYYIDKNIEKTPLVDEKERKQLIEVFNDTKVDYPKDTTIVDLFEEQVKKTPNTVALIFEGKELTYEELNDKSNQLGNYLQENYNIKPDDLVGVKLDRSENLLVAILGVLKSGAGYVPIDTNYPQDRIDYIEKDCNAKVVIDQTLFEYFEASSSSFSKSNIKSQVISNNLAYVIYTSGTTGKPKGVMVLQSNAVAMLYWAKQEFSSKKINVVYAATSHCFDLSIYEMFFPLSIGKLIKLFKNPLEIGRSIENDTQILINTVPSNIRNLIDTGISLENVSIINLAGEPFPVDIANKLKSTKAVVRNLYGPSEDTTYSTSYKLTSETIYKSSVPIGKPISNTRVYILDDNLELLPIGVSGRLYISGDGLAQGYLNRPDLTSERFVANPYELGQKMYDTGDMAKWLPDGDIEFMGRKDFQVKLRGYRIELGEIENTILSYSEDITQVVSVVKKESLFVYYTEKTAVDTEGLKSYLEAQLPSYMVPTGYEVLDSIPLTPNGKLDRKALESLEVHFEASSNYVAPRNKTEEKLVEIWQEVLGIENIGIRDNFFELGGHSLMVGQVINQIYKQLEGTISYQDFFQNPVIEQVSILLKKEGYISIPKVEELEYYLLTPSQHRIWVLSQLGGGSQAYNMSGVLTFSGYLDLFVFRQAFQQLINKYEVLRTYFKSNESGDVFQYIQDVSFVKFDIDYIDFQGYERECVDGYLRKEQVLPFDLTEGPLLRSSLLKINEEEHLFSFVMHHIIGDGWSMELLTSEVVSIYNNLLNDKTYKVSDLRLQYKDYSEWIQTQLASDSYKASELYWVEKFKGELPLLDLPSFKKRPAIQTYNGKTITHEFSKDFLIRLKDFSRQNGVTLFMTLMSGINTLLYRYTNQEDIIIGTPIAGRDHPDLENQIGLYLNTLAIRTELNAAFSFKDLLLQQKETLLEAYEHQSYPFDELVSKLDLQRDTSRSALFDVMVVLQNQNQLSISSHNHKLNSIDVSSYDLDRNTSQVDVSFTFSEENEALSLEIEYNTDIYDSFLLQRVFSHFENLLNAAVSNPSKGLLSIDYLTNEELKQILEEFNDTVEDYPKDNTIVDLFEEQVIKTPNAIAVIFEDTQLTYKELNEKSNQLGNYLQKNYNVQPDDLVGLKLDRSENLLVAILGVLKSGAGYVPIDTNYPQDRIDYIEKDCNAKLVINQDLFEDFERLRSNFSKDNVISQLTPNDLAYVIYTSGTTGKPKGVMVEHRNLISIHLSWREQYQLDLFRVNLLQLASVSFDVFVGDLCRSLLNGGTMIVPSDSVKMDSEALYELLQKYKVSIFEGTPALIIPLLNYIKSNNKDYSFLRRIIFGSDSFSNSIFNEIKKNFESSNLKVINSYGVTEATIDSTFYDNYETNLQGTTPVGKPFSNSRIYILNKYKQHVPVGVFGEVFIGGNGVSRGYHNHPELTQTKFINLNNKERVYTTGDIARWLPDGNIDFLGRNDNQVKVRGYRIELEGIENTLVEYSESIEQVVLSIKDVNNEKILVAYYTSSTKIEKNELKSFLSEKLPDYMLPSFFVQLETMPLTPNGKIDKNRLPNISEEDIIRKIYVEPKNEVEEQLVSIWKEVLNLEIIGVQDNFFELGGHSLKITKLRSHINKEFGASLSFDDLFLKTTISEQALLIKNTSKSEFEFIPKAPIKDYYPLSSSQKRIWVLSQFEGGNIAYNMSGIFEVSGVIKEKVLHRAFETLIERHEVLRTRFVQKKSGEIEQSILTTEANDFKFTCKEFINSSDKEIKHHIKKEIEYSFDLKNDCLLKATLFQKEKGQFILTVVIHHIISDGWSIDLLTNELFTLYNAYLLGHESPLEPLSIQYKDFAVWEEEMLNNPKFNKTKTYWLEQFSNEIPVLDLPYKQKRPIHKTYEGKVKTISISEELVSKLNYICKENDSTLFMGLLTLVKILLYRYTNQKDIIIGTPIAGREHIQLQNQLGVYINTLALRTQFDGKDSFKAVLNKVKETTIKAYENQSYPFDRLVNDLNLTRNLGRNPLFDIMVTLQNTDQQSKVNNTINDVLINEVQVFEEIACKFDLDFIFEEVDNQFNLSIIYNTSLFSDEFITKFCEQFNLLIQSSTNKPKQPIYQLEILPDNQMNDLLEIGKGTKQVRLDTNKTFIDYFNEWVLKAPTSTAIQDCKIHLSYSELNEKSNAIARYLEDTISDEETTIGVVLGRTVNTIVILLGILKLGKAYIPLDPTFPEERLRYIVSHSKTKKLICDNKFSFFDTKDVTVLNTKTILSEELLGSYKTDNLKLPKAEDTAYIIYTSGSTGNPKGVEVGHCSLMNFLLSIKRKLDVNPKDSLYAVTTYSFDISILEFFVPLVSGAKVFIADNETLLDGEKIINNIESVQPSIVQATPSFYQLLFNAGWKGNKRTKVLCGGDSLSKSLAFKLLESSKELWNMYGPTETTIWSSIKQIKNPNEASNIGTAIDNTLLYVLGKDKELLPKGTQGALYIGGEGLAKGYYKDSLLTKQRFVKNPYDKGLLYETGDIVKWNSRNELIFLGRNDHQVKVRGYRIELADIETNLNAISEINQAITIVKKDNFDEALLVVFYVSSQEIEISELKRKLRINLPDYMIPSQFIRLEVFPLTPNKKVDRKALLEMSFDQSVDREFKEPISEIEVRLLVIWKEYFNLEKISIDDNFFDLGGHSLTATKLVSKIQEEFSIKLSINKIFENVTIEQQAKLLENLVLANSISNKEVSETELEKFTI